MVKKIIGSLPLTTIILIYLYVCGSLYLIAYWSTFDIDISNFVGITEIPKSFVFPFVISNFSFLFLWVINMASNKDIGRKDDELPREVPSKFDRILFNPDIYIFIGIILLNFLWLAKQSFFLWVVGGLTLALALGSKVSSFEFVKKAIPYYVVRNYMITMIVLTPIACVVWGKVNSIKIYKNDELKYIKAIPADSSQHILAINDSTQLKLLGFLGDKIIISSIDNERMFILNHESFNILEIKKWKKK